MKYAVLIIAVFMLASCTDNSEQVQVVRNMMLKRGGVNAKQLSKVDFSVQQTPDTVVYNRLIDYNTKMINDSGAGPYDSGVSLLSQTIDSLQTAKKQGLNKTFYTVRMERNERGLQGIRDFYLSDDNRIIGSELIKSPR